MPDLIVRRIRDDIGRVAYALRRPSWQDAWDALHPGDSGHTFTPRNDLVSGVWRPRPGRRIDYILVRCGTKGAGLDITSCELAFAEPVDGVWASDHYGVVADITLRAPTTDPP